MAEETTKKKLSPETEAIIDRLKREGQLTRNSEGNSIKSIKINLDKFADAFTAIQKSSEDTARIMTENFVDGNTEILKKVDESLEGLTDEQKKAELQGVDVWKVILILLAQCPELMIDKVLDKVKHVFSSQSEPTSFGL